MRYLLSITALLAATSCGATIPSDTMSRLYNVMGAASNAYAALCVGREKAPECVAILESLDTLAVEYAKLNSELAK